MGFIIQLECPDCGYSTPEEADPKSLIDPLDMPNLYICECRDCQNLFQILSQEIDGGTICQHT